MNRLKSVLKFNFRRDSKTAGNGHSTPKEGLKSIVSTLLILLAAPVIALFLTMFVFQSYEVDGPSMETALQDNDRLIVLKVPRTWARITGRPYIPTRGDVVVFEKEGISDYGSESGRQLIKRVIALPGERVVISDGELTVYNQAHPEGFQPDKEMDYGNSIPSTPGTADLVVPEGHVFLCGDNRNNSLDSRVFGPVPADDIVGKLAARVYPFGKAKAF